MELILNLPARRIARGLLAVTIGLLVLSNLGRLLLFHFPQVPGLNAFAHKVYLDEEANIPALYAVLALMFAGGLLHLIATLEAQRQSATRKYWRILGWIFCGLAIDEWIGFHELLIQPFGRLGWGGFFHYAWVIPGMAVVLAVGLWSIGFLKQLSGWLRRRFVLAGGLYVLGALGFEMLDGKVVDRLGEEGVLFDPVYQSLMTCEEGLEKLAIVLFIYTLLQYLNQQHQVHQLRLSIPGSYRAQPGLQPEITLGPIRD
jgi:hypothetical protein